MTTWVIKIGTSLLKGSDNYTTFDIINHSIVAKGNYWILVHSHREFYFAQEYKDSKKVSNASLIDINKLGNSDVYYSGKKIGFKPAGGISTAKGVLDFLILVYEELGQNWIKPSLLRLSSRVFSDHSRACCQTSSIGPSKRFAIVC